MSSARVVAEALRARQSFILTSHARPDGDAIGSQVALALALDQLGKQVRLVDRDPAPVPYRDFPAMDRIELASRAEGAADAVVLLECSDPTRPEVDGLDAYPMINVDHHLGNTMYGAINWFDSSAAACGEMVAEIIDALDVPWTQEMAAHLYLAISTDTGGFRFGPITGRTFEICRRIAETGLDLPTLSRRIFDSYSLGRVRLMGALLSKMELHCDNRLALLSFDEDLLAENGASIDDTEGLVNVPLGAREILAVALFKRQNGNAYRLSLRSKGTVDVRQVAMQFNGGGHRNAAGCTIDGDCDEARRQLVEAIGAVLDAAPDGSPVRA
jgi:phosphoesterase RecJ-like protein